MNGDARGKGADAGNVRAIRNNFAPSPPVAYPASVLPSAGILNGKVKAKKIAATMKLIGESN